MTVPLPPTGPLLQSPPRAETVRFIYSAGDRPLEGYTIKRGVGRGGFGEVYYGTSDGGKEVALKLVQRNLEVELRGVSQCLNLKHPNLVGLYDIRQAETGDYWIVMEYVAGDSLAELLDRHPQGLTKDEALQWIEGICAAVAYLHDRGIVHRDLKPANIFREDGTVKIGDYGLSKFITTSRRSGQTESVGTVHYMAPEIANGRYGKEIDVYAAGVILYEMLTGQVPFDGESVGEILMKHLTAEPDVSHLGEPYRRVVSRALSKDPQHRYATIGQMVADLHGAAGAGGAAKVRTIESPAAPAPLPGAPGPLPPNRGEGPIELGEKDLVGGPVVRRRSVPPPPPQGGIWAEFVREDPIVCWLRDLCRSISPNNPWHVAAVAGILILVATTGFLGGTLPIVAVCYVAVALAIRWFKGPSDSAAGATRRSVAAPHLADRADSELGAPLSERGTSQSPSREVKQELEGAPPRATGAFAAGRALRRSVRLFFGLGGLVLAIALVMVAVFGMRAGGTDGMLLLLVGGLTTSCFLALLALPVFYGLEKRVAAKGAVVRPGRLGGRTVTTSGASAPKTMRCKLIELTGSMLAVFPVVLLLCFVLSTIAPPMSAPTMIVLGEVAVAGSLAVLAVAKWWEGRSGDPWVRRCVMLVVGMTVGAFAAELDRTLWITWGGGEVDFAWFGPEGVVGDGANLFTPDGQPTFMGYLAYFGMLFFLIPWWRLTDPARRVRLSIWKALVIPGAIAWLLLFVWPFPQPWGLIWAVMIAVTVQLVSPRQEHALVEGR